MLIPAGILWTIALTIGLTILPGVSSDIFWAVLLFGIGFSFIYIYIKEKKQWWAILPGGTLLTLSFSDDLEAPLQAVNKFRQYFPQADSQQAHLRPGENGLTSIGHWGFFKKHQGKVLWPLFLNAFLQGSGEPINKRFTG